MKYYQLKSKLFFFISTLLLITGIPSCKKKEQVEIVMKGNISDASLNAPLANATIRLYKLPLGESNFILISQTQLSSNGEYSFTFGRDKFEKIKLVVEKPLYFTLNEEIQLSELSVENDNVRNYSTTAKSWVRIVINNENPNSNDQLDISMKTGKLNCDECCSSSKITFNGPANESIYCINDAFHPFAINFTDYSNANIGTLGTTSNIFDTVDIILNY